MESFPEMSDAIRREIAGSRRILFGRQSARQLPGETIARSIDISSVVQGERVLPKLRRVSTPTSTQSLDARAQTIAGNIYPCTFDRHGCSENTPRSTSFGESTWCVSCTFVSFCLVIPTR